MSALSERLGVSSRSFARPGAEREVVANFRGRHLGLLDRAWLGSWSSLLMSPVVPRSVDDIRAAISALHASDPDHVLVRNLDASRRRWRQIPAADIAAYCEQVVTKVADPDPSEADDFVTAHLPSPAYDAPFRLLVGQETVVLYINHALGDGVTMTRLMHGLITADLDGLIGLEPRAHWGTLAAGLATNVRRNGARYHRPGGVPTGSGPVDTAAAGPNEAHLITQVVGNAAVRSLLKWRSKNAPGVALSSVLTSAIYLSLVGQGLPIDSSGYYGLIDVRRYLRPDDQSRAGNLAKSLFIAADPGDPRAVEAALGFILDSGWALPSALYGTLVTALHRPTEDVDDPGARVTCSPITLTVSIVPNPPCVDTMPWAAEGQRRYVGVGSAKSGPSVNMFASRLRSHLELAATFRTTVVAADKVRAALDALVDPVSVLDALSPTSSGPGRE